MMKRKCKARKHQACLDVMPSRSLSYAKIMQTESRDSSLLVIYAEVQLIFCKDNAFLLIQQSKWLQINIIW